MNQIGICFSREGGREGGKKHLGRVRPPHGVGVPCCGAPVAAVAAAVDSGAQASCGSPVSLPAILEPVGDLRHRQSGLLGQRTLLVRGGVPVDLVRLLQAVPRLLLEAVHGLLAVPDGARQGKLAPESVFIHSA